MTYFTNKFYWDEIEFEASYEYTEETCCNDRECGCEGQMDVEINIISVTWKGEDLKTSQVDQIIETLIEKIEEKHKNESIPALNGFFGGNVL